MVRTLSPLKGWIFKWTVQYRYNAAQVESRTSKEAKPIVLYDAERDISLKLMQGNLSSFQDDLGYTQLFHIPAVISVSF